MKFLFLLILVFSEHGMALKMESELIWGSSKLFKKAYTENGELNMGYFVTCQGSSLQTCQDLCSASTCLLSLDSCESCITSRNLNIFALYRDFSKLFVFQPGAVDMASVFRKLRAGELRIIDENAIVNLFDDTQSDEKYEIAKRNFASSCPTGTEAAFLAIDPDFIARFYICQGSFGQKVYQTRFNPEFSK